MIYAKVDVKLRDHERAHRAGSAMGTWTWALLYVREQETDGYIPDVALRGAWAGEKQALADAKRLVSVGLWETIDGGWRICRYEAKNETRAAIAERRAGASERMRRVRANKRRTSAEPSEGEQRAVPGSGYGSGVVLDLEGGAGGATPPGWWAAAIAAAEMAVGPVGEHLARWLEYDAARERKGWARNHRDAVGWLTTVVRGEKRNARASPPARAADLTKQPFDPEAPWMKIGDTGT